MRNVSQFSVASLNPGERFDAWQDSIGCLFDVSRPQVEADRFFASIDSMILGQAMLARTRSVGQSWHRPAWKIARDGLDHYMIQLYSLGSQVYHGSDEARPMPQAGLLVYDLTRPMGARTSQFENISLIIPRTALAPLLAAPDDHHMRPLSADAPFVQLLRSSIEAMWRHGRTASDRQVRNLFESCIHLTAACLNIETGSAMPRAHEPVSHLVIARRLIEDSIGLPELGADWLIARLGLSRSRVYELFRDLGGVAGYIRERRLATAMHMLTDPVYAASSIAEIARACGFTPSELSRSFRRHYGVSPRGARHRAFGDTAHHEDSQLDRRYEHWIRHLAPA